MAFYPDTVWEFNITPKKFGIGALDEIGYEAKRLGAKKKVLIITMEEIVQAGHVDVAKKSLNEAGLEVDVWDKAQEDPGKESMEECIEFSKDKGYEVFIGFGGGSSMDTAKVVSTILTHGGEIMDYIAPPTGRGKPVPGPIKPVLAVPTTAGTGAETSPAAVVSLWDLKLKEGVSSHFCRPRFAILDPRVTITLPPKWTAYTGMDALVHALGSYVAPRYDTKPKPETPGKRPAYGGRTLLTDFFAEKAIEMVGKHLRRAVLYPRDLEARSGMLLAANWAGVAFTNSGVDTIHSAAYPIGGQFKSHHGETIGVLAPAFVEYNIPAEPERFARTAQLLGERIEGLSLMEAARKAYDAILSLYKDIGMPSGLEEFGITEKDIPRIAKDTFKIQRLLVWNPRIPTEDDIATSLKKALRYF